MGWSPQKWSTNGSSTICNWIAESCATLAWLSAEDMAEIFTEWNKGELDSYFWSKSLRISWNDRTKVKMDHRRPHLGRAGNKGSGKWTSQSRWPWGAVTITESVFARYISAYKERVHSKGSAAFKFEGDKAELVGKDSSSSLLLKIISYAQGFAQLRVASKENNWNLPFADIASIWRDDVSSVLAFWQKDYRCLQPWCRSLTFFWWVPLDVTAKYQQSVRDIVALLFKVYQYLQPSQLPSLTLIATVQRIFQQTWSKHNVITLVPTHTNVKTEGTSHYSWYDENNLALCQTSSTSSKWEVPRFIDLELQKRGIVDVAEDVIWLLITATKYDLILLNYDLSDMSGEAFAEEISQIRPASVLIVLIAAKNCWAPREYSALCRFYMVKPFIISDLVDKITAILEDVIILTNIVPDENFQPHTTQSAHWWNTIPSIAGEDRISALTCREYAPEATLMGNKGGDTRSVVGKRLEAWEYGETIVDVYIR